ncbi:hypothetical protein M569_02345 [Genlisea aurea]|uniref:Ribosomal protein S1 n=1 Tax=Genlisea aurea TaxID=192259 RepID=S8E987_9LAMI|nr:hypothetical protein M569_02345 [Genlisea aurea]
MSGGYMSRLFRRSNSSMLFQSGNALDAKVVRLRDQMYLVDAGIGRPRIATKDELIITTPNPSGAAPFNTAVGFLPPSNKETYVKNIVLQRCFVDLITGNPRTKQQAGARLEDAVGTGGNATGDEQPLLLPQKLRKQRALTELEKKMKGNKKVRGFVAEKVWGGYSVGIAGYVAFLPARQAFYGRNARDRFLIESINRKNIVVSQAG